MANSTEFAAGTSAFELITPEAGGETSANPVPEANKEKEEDKQGRLKTPFTKYASFTLRALRLWVYIAPFICMYQGLTYKVFKIELPNHLSRS